jgi:hypothetical protein
VGLALKSGTKQLHGEAFWQHRKERPINKIAAY